MKEQRRPRIDSAVPASEPNISDAIHDSSESDKDISSKPTATSEDDNSNSQKKDPAYWYERSKEALKNHPEDSKEHCDAEQNINRLEKLHPHLKSTDSLSGDENLSSTNRAQESQNPVSQPTDTSKGNLSGDYGQNADPNATGDFTYYLKNPDAPRSMNVDDMRDRYSQEKAPDNPMPTEPTDTDEKNIT